MMCYTLSMTEDYFLTAPPEHIKREKSKAQELRKSQWWKSQLAQRKCHYCEGEFAVSDLTMDHVIPIIRGGLTSRSNVVTSCKECNNKKKYFTPAEMALQALKESDQSKSSL
ncbi:MAG: HNH endonuclease [Bdellovibrionota bacterium]